jgi:hypothetical protein
MWWKEIIRLRSIEGQPKKGGVFSIRWVSDTIFVMIFSSETFCGHPRTTLGNFANHSLRNTALQYISVEKKHVGTKKTWGVGVAQSV